MCAIIYGSNWYSYDLKSQRIIMVLLHDSQKSKEIYLQIIGPLNVVTFISVISISSIYFYYSTAKCKIYKLACSKVQERSKKWMTCYNVSKVLNLSNVQNLKFFKQIFLKCLNFKISDCKEYVYLLHCIVGNIVIAA